MNKIYTQALLVGAMSTFIITPAFSETTESATAGPELIADASSTMQNPETSTSEPLEQGQVQPGQTQQESGMNQSVQTQQGSSMNQTISSELYSLRPNQLLEKEVRNSNEEKVGKVTEVVSSRQDGQVHVVISKGGFMGIGASEYVIPLHGLSMNDDKLYLRSAAGKDLRQEYMKDRFVMIQPKDRPISEFSAFEERQQ